MCYAALGAVRGIRSLRRLLENTMIQASLRKALFASMALAGLLAFQAQALEPSDADATTPPATETETGVTGVEAAEPSEDVARITPATPASLSTELAKAGLAQQGIDSPSQEQVDAASADVQAMRASGMGWGAIANSMGVRLGSVVSSLNRSKRATDVQASKAIKTATKTPTKSKPGSRHKPAASDEGTLTNVASGEADGTTPSTATSSTGFRFNLGFLGKGRSSDSTSDGDALALNQRGKDKPRGADASGRGNGNSGSKGGGNASGGNKGGSGGSASGGGRGNGGGNKGGRGGGRGNGGGNGGGKGKR